MKKVDSLHSLDSIKVLADSRRLEILRLMMASPATLTQLARDLEQSPAWIRHHILALEAAGLGEVSEIHVLASSALSRFFHRRLRRTGQ